MRKGIRLRAEPRDANRLCRPALIVADSAYLGDALDALRAGGYPVADEGSAHLHDHINFYGIYSFDLETELRREGRRPLHSPAA